MIGIYVRVSTLRQKDNYSYKAQEEEGVRFADSIGESYQVYKEAKTGTKGEKEREQFSVLRDDVDKGLLDKVYIIKEDRLSRNTMVALSFIQLLIDKNVGLFIGGREQDLSDPTTIFVLTVTFGQAQLARDNIVSTGKANLHKWIDSGNIAYPKLFGYRWRFTDRVDRNGNAIKEWYPMESELRIVKMVFDWFFEGKSFWWICNTLNDKRIPSRFGAKWTASQVTRIIRKPVYSGYVYNTKGEIIKSNIYQIEVIPLKRWQEAQVFWKTNRKRQGDWYKYAHHICSSIIRCSMCNGAFIHARRIIDPARNTRYRTYTVYENYVVHHKKDCELKGSKSVLNAELIETLFTALYFMTFEDYKAIEVMFAKKRKAIEKDKEMISSDLVRYQKLVEQHKRQKKNLVDAIANFGMDQTIRDRLDLIVKEEEELSNRIQSIKRDLAIKDRDLVELMDEFAEERLNEFWDASPALKRNILLKAVESAVHREHVLTIKFITGKEYTIDVDNIPEHINNRIELVREDFRIIDADSSE